MQVNRSGFYAWLAEPKSRREIEDERLLGQIKQFWIESGFSYGYRNITKDLKDTGELNFQQFLHKSIKLNQY